MSVELDMRYVVVESGRRSCGVRFDILRVRLWRKRERGIVRSMAIECRKDERQSIELSFHAQKLFLELM